METNYGEEGIWYDEVYGKEYLLTLVDDSNTFTMLLDNEVVVGTYKYDGQKLTLTIAGEENKVEANFANGAFTFEYNGVTYSFLKKVDYTVTYETNGGSAIAATKVMNGKTFEKPADPVKDGYNFVGWYADAEFKTPFFFEAPVSGDVTIYARYESVKAGQNEFTVAFNVDGNTATYEAKQTISGKVFDLPTPTKEGATFAGWWTSDFEDATKLTCKYEGQALKENTTLYAVWASAAPAVSVDATGVRWSSDAVNPSYKLNITAPNEDDSVLNHTLGDATYAYDFASKAAGEYKIEVTLGENKTTVYYNNKQLDNVSLFTVVEPSVLLFNAVENAEKYLITVDCGDDDHKHTDFDNGSSLYFNFSNCEMQEGGIKFTVKAVANGYVTSESETFEFSRDLTAVTGLTVDAANEQVSWKRVDNALSYVVEIKIGETTTKVNVGAATVYSLKEYSGDMTIGVYPIAAGYNSPTATQVTYAKANLATPSNVRVEGKTLLWDAVAGATKYKVKIGAQEFETEEATYDLSNLKVASEYQISIQAVGATADKNSAFTDTMVVKMDTMVDLPVYKQGKISWTPVLEADGYGIRVNGGKVQKVAGNLSSASVKLTQAGVNTVEVASYYKGAIKTDWIGVEVYAYEIALDSCGGTEVAPMYKAIGDEIELPTDLTNGGYIFAGWYNVPNGPKNNGSKFVDEYYMISGNTTLYAYWTPEKYEVNLIVDETMGTLDVTTGSVYYRENFELPIATSKDTTRVFGGWYSQPNGDGTKYTDPLGVSEAVWGEQAGLDLYAHWIDVFKFNSIDNGEAYSVSQGVGISYVTEITIPVTYNGKPVTTVEGSAFKSCSNLKKIRIPDTIQLVSIPVDGGNGTGSPFQYCSKLNDVEVYCVDPENHNKHEVKYSSVDGVLLYHDNGEVQLKYVPRARRGSFTVPDGVTTIPVNAFKDSYVSEVRIPASVTRIDETAFSVYSFITRSYLTSVVFLPAAEGQKEQTLTIADNAFKHCTSLKSVTLPARLKDFSVDIFAGSSALTEIYIEGNPADGETIQYASTEDGVLTNAKGDTLVYVPKARTGEYVIPKGIKTIGAGAFQGCTGITQVTIPGWVENIESAAFRNCTTLRAVNFQGVETDMPLNIESYAFYGCSGLTEVTLPANLGKLEKYAFGDTKNLRTVSLVGANMELENVAFGTYATTPEYFVRTLKLGKDVKEFEITGVFGGESLTKVEVEVGNSNYTTTDDGVLFNGDKSKIVYFPSLIGGKYVIPDEVKTIPAEIFRNKKFTEIVIGKNVETIGAGAFLDCVLLETVTFAMDGTADLSIAENAFKGCVKVSEIVLPERTVSIGDYAFASTNLASIDIPAKTTTLGTSVGTVFEGCTSIAAVNVAASNEKFASVDGIVYGKVSDVATTLYYCPALKGGVVDIPKTVTYIAEKAFYGNKNVTEIKFSQGIESDLSFGANVFTGTEALETVTLPVGLTSISKELFLNNESLKTVVIPYTVSSIASGAFNGCINLATVTFEEAPAGVTAPSLVIENSAGYSSGGVFGNTYALKTFTVPARTTQLGSYAFYSSSIESLNIPASVTYVGDYLCYLAKSLTSFTVENGSDLTNLGDSTLRDCEKLTEVKLPENLERIGGGMFYNCKALQSITIPGTVTEIANGSGINAFGSCTELVSVTFEDGEDPLEIGNSTFSGCVKLPSIIIPARTKKIGSSVFSGCTLLVSVTFATNLEGFSYLESIGDSAFAATGLTEIEFPEVKKLVVDAETNDVTETTGALTLGKTLFDSCLSLTRVKLSATVASIDGTFMNSGSITTFEVAPGNPNVFYDEALHIFTNNKTIVGGTDTYVDAWNYLYGAAHEGLVDAEGTLTIPEGIVELGANVFVGRKGIKKVIIPSTLKTIGNSAFKNCSELTTVEFAGTPTLETISSSAFEGCTALTAFAMPNSVTTLGTGVFSGCKVLESVTLSNQLETIPSSTFSNCAKIASFTIPASVTSIGSSAFNGCKAMTTIEFHDNVESIDSSAFANCSQLDGVTLPKKLTKLNNAVFYKCTSLTSIAIPEGVTDIGTATGTSQGPFEGCSKLVTVTLPESLTSIYEGAFRSCSKLTGVVLPTNLTLLGREAFKGCSSLTNMEIPVNITSIYTSLASGIASGLFQNCSKIESVTFRGDLTSIPDATFSGCTKLSTFNIPESVTYIGNSAFYNCKALTSIVVPEVSAIGTSAFENCALLSSVTLDDNIYEIGVNAFKGCKALKTITLPSGLAAISNYMFQGSGLESITIPEAVTSIGECAFQNCSSLASVNMNETLKSIGSNAFENTDLRSVMVPATVEYIGGAVFFGCTNLGDLSVSSENLTYAMDASGTLWGDNMKRIVSFSSTAVLEGGVLELSDGMSFDEYAFYGCTNIKKIVIPDTMTAIPAYAFYGCTNLMEVVYGANIESVGAYAFYGCSGLDNANLPDTVTTISTSAFENTGITSLTINNVSYLGANAFAGTLITSLELPATLTPIKAQTETMSNTGGFFKNCTELKTVTFNCELTDIYKSFFENCSSLESIEIPDTVLNIDNNAFKGCTSLASIKIPSGLKSLDDYVFAGTAITEFTFPGTVGSPGAFTFTDCKNLKKVVFEDGPKYFSYYSNSNWGAAYMFQGCTALEEVVLPETLQGLRADGYNGGNGSIFGALEGYELPSLKKIIIPASVTTLKKNVFSQAPADFQVYCRGSEAITGLKWDVGYDEFLTLPVIWDYEGD
ncbi:MAG: leucine-rich repeat protein [Clostridia bacterium]|nr:leucine-rich repeat protein [Clostridia bacterium]